MKNPIKLIAAAILIAAVFFTFDMKAQTTPANKFTLNLAAETGIPEGVAKLGATNTLGGTIRLQYGLTNDLALTLTTGGYHFFPKLSPKGIRYPSYGEIPVKLGLKEFFIKNVYVGAEAGFAGEKEESGWGPTRFDWSPALGFTVGKHWDLGAHYEAFTRHGEDVLSLINLRVSYGFGL